MKRNDTVLSDNNLMTISINEYARSLKINFVHALIEKRELH